MSWLKWVLMYTFEWIGDVEADDEREAEGRRHSHLQSEGLLREGGVKFGALRHELWKVKEGLVCRRCGGLWKAWGEAEEERGRGHKCSGCVAGKVAAHGTGNHN